MGLTVSNQNFSITSLLNKQTDATHKFSQQLTSGLKINQAKDKPAGLVVSEMLRAQISGLTQGVENSERAISVVNVAEGGLSNISSQLTDARALAVEAANSGAMDSSQVSALQGQLNSILGGIDFQANNTSFAGQNLLDGSRAIQTDNVDANIENMDITSAIDGTVNIDVTAEATAAQADGTLADNQATDETIVIQGALGTAELQVSAGQSQADIEAAINALSDQTGVQSSSGVISSVEVGSEASVSITGNLTGITEGETIGTDIEGTINGASAQGSGNSLTSASSSFTGTITMAQGSGTGDFSAEVTGGGMQFQLGANSGESVRVGLNSAHTSSLGSSSGVGSMRDLLSGGSASLSQNPSAAIDIIDAAIAEVSSQRADLGAFTSNTLESNISSLSTDIVNTTDSESRIRDTDFAKSIMDYLQSQLQEKSTISMGVQANTNAKNILSLLGS